MTRAAENGALERALRAAAGWSAREKAGQLFLLAFPGKDPSRAAPLIAERNLCGCYLSQDNAESFAEARALTAALNAAAAGREPRLPLLLGVDQEGAWGVLVPESATGPGNMALGAAPAEMAAEMYRLMGEEMLEAGFNLLLAPCADVNADRRSPIIGTRSFGDRPEEVARRVAAAVRGAAESGILTTVKHFPGHGGTGSDTHRGLPSVTKELARLESEDFLPFKAGIAEGVDVVMTSHIAFPAIDRDRPATLSRKILKGILREDMGFKGLVLSDSMNMGAIKKNYEPGEAAVLALEAGVDVVMLSEEHYDHSAAYLERQRESLNAVEEAILSGRLPMSEVDAKIERIIKLRYKAGSRARPTRGGNARLVEARAARAACSLLFDSKGLWPVPEEDSAVVVNATPREAYKRVMNPRGIGPNQAECGYDSFKKTLSRLRPRLRFLEHEEFASSIESLALRTSRIILVTEDYPLPGEDFPVEKQRSLVRAAIAAAPGKCIVVGLRSPYEVSEYPGLSTYFCAFSSRACSAAAAAEILHEGGRGEGLSPVRYE
jgi:beta-N-acetylhexosaminidase